MARLRKWLGSIRTETLSALSVYMYIKYYYILKYWYKINFNQRSNVFLFDVRYNDYVIHKKTATTMGTGSIRIKYWCRSIRFLIVVAPFAFWLLLLHSFPDCCRFIRFCRVNSNLTVLNSKERSIVSLKPSLQWELRKSSFALALVEMVCTAN